MNTIFFFLKVTPNCNAIVWEKINCIVHAKKRVNKMSQLLHLIAETLPFRGTLA